MELVHRTLDSRCFLAASDTSEGHFEAASGSTGRSWRLEPIAARTKYPCWVNPDRNSKQREERMPSSFLLPSNFTLISFIGKMNLKANL